MPNITGQTGTVDTTVTTTTTTTTGDGILSVNGTASAMTEFTSTRYGHVTEADFNNDGVLDTIVTERITGRTVVELRLSDGVGGYNTSTVIDAGITNPGGGSIDNLVGDINGDGNLDLMQGGNGTRWWLGDGNGGFTFDDVNFGIAADLLVDVNGDGHLDQVVYANSTGVWSSEIHLGDGAGNFGAKIDSGDMVYGFANLVDSGDVNGDGNIDLLMEIGGAGNPSAQILLGNGDGTFTLGHSIGTSQTEYGDQGALYDIDNDGNLDMVVAGKTSGTEYQFLYSLGNGDGTFGATQEVGSGNRTSFGRMEIGDLNGDGYAEIAVRTNIGGAELFSFDGSSFSSEGVFDVAGGGSNVRSIAFADIDDDGDKDFLIATDGDGMNLFENTTNAIVTTTTTTTTTVPGDGRDFFPVVDLATQNAAREALDNVRLVQELLAQAVGQLGAEQSRLLSAYQVIQTESLNVFDAGTRIDDADIASVTAQNASNQIRMQAASSVASQANQNGRLVLEFL